MKLSRLLAVMAAGAMATAGLLVPHAQAAPVSKADAIERLDAAVRLEAGVATGGNAKTRGPVEKLRRDARDRSVVYVRGDSDAVLRKAVAASGGAVSDVSATLVRAAVPRDRLVELAQQAGVREVRRPDVPVPMAITSEGAQLSRALDWQQNGQQGAGVKVGILDVGFGRLEATQAQGELPASGITTYDGNCGAEHSSSHGTTMAEVVHDMAPKASLYLACVTDTLDFDDAARWLQQQGVKVVSVSMAFPGVARGDGRVDGSAADWDPATVVRWLRGANILVVAAAGNEADKHWTNQVADSDANGWVNISGTSEAQSFSVPARGSAPGESKITVELKWDAWPTTNTDLDVFVMSAAHKPANLNDPDLAGRYSIRPQEGTPGGLTPIEKVEFELGEETAVYWVYIQIKSFQLPSSSGRYDLTVYGPGSGFAHTNPAGTIAEPATSPFALAVGAMTPENQAASGPVEKYSGRGPTIDGRFKPDLTGFTNVSTFTRGTKPNPTLGGTSVAAAHVAGAAALLLGANPTLDASQLETVLRDNASRQDLSTTIGRGVLDLGAFRTPNPPKGSAYTPMSLRRVLNTFSDTGGHPGTLKAGEEFTLRIPDLPSDTTAVALQLTGFPDGIPENTTTQVEVYPDLGRRTGVVAMEVTSGKIGETMVIATLDPVNKVVRIRNSAAELHLIADLIGYFSTDSSASTYFPLKQSVRIQDTRTYETPGAKYGAGETRKTQIRGVAGVPGNATAAVVNVTASDPTEYTHLDVFPTTKYGAWALSPYAGEELTHEVIVPIGEDGSIKIFNEHGSVHVAVDLVGWFAPGNGARYVPLRHPTRVLDTSTGMAAAKGPLGTGSQAALVAGGVGTVPYNATGTVVSMRPGKGPRNVRTKLSIWGSDHGWSGQHSAISDNTTRYSQSNVAFTTLGPNRLLELRNNTGQNEVGVDLWGYFVGGQPAAEGNLPAPSGWWKFDEGTGTTTADASGGGRTATISGGMTWSGGRAGGHSGWFDGSSFATTATPPVRTDQSFTVSAWTILQKTDGFYTVLGLDGSATSPFFLQYTAGGTNSWTFSTTSSDVNEAAATRATAATPPTVNRWTHLVGVYDATAKQTRLYVNGALAGQSNNVTLWNPVTPGGLVIGAAKWNGARVDKYPGFVEDVRTYASALTEAQVRKLHGDTPVNDHNRWKFDEGSGTTARSAGWPDLSLTLSSGAGWTSGVSGSALALNGSATSYASMVGPEVQSPGSYTVSAWAKLANTAVTQAVVSQDGVNVRGFALQYRTDTNRWAFAVPLKDEVGGQAIATSAAAPTVGKWTHLAGVYDAGARQLRLYVDGRFEGVADGFVPWSSFGATQVGRNKWAGQTDPFTGAIDEVRGRLGAASAAEILAEYQSTAP